MGNVNQITTGGFGPVTSVPIVTTNDGVGLSTQLIIWGMVACILAELIGICCLLRFCCNSRNRRKTKFIEKEIIIREDLKKDPPTTTMPNKGVTTFTKTIPSILQNEKPRPWRTPSPEARRQREQLSSSRPKSTNSTPRRQGVPSQRSTPRDAPPHTSNSTPRLQPAESINSLVSEDQPSKISHTEFETLYDVDETKFSTIKSYYMSKEKLIRQQDSTDLLIEHSIKTTYSPSVLQDLPIDRRLSVPVKQTIPSRDGFVYLYDGIINAAFADVSHAELRQASPIHLEETQQLPRIVKRFEPPEEEIPLSTTRFRSYSPDHSVRIVPPVKHHRPVSDIEFRHSTVKHYKEDVPPVLLSYGQEKNSGVPIKWHVAKELRTVDWDQMKKDSIIERSYPHANLIEPVLDTSKRSDVRRLFEDEKETSFTKTPVHSVLDTVLPPLAPLDTYDSGANKVGLEVPYTNPFATKSVYSSPRRTFTHEPITKQPSKEQQQPETIEKYKYNNLDNSNDKIKNETEKKTIIEKLINDLDTDENVNEDGGLKRHSTVSSLPTVVVVPPPPSPPPQPAHADDDVNSSRRSSNSNVSRVEVRGNTNVNLDNSTTKYINRVDVVSEEDRRASAVSSITDTFPLPPDLLNESIKQQPDTVSILNQSHTSLKQNPLFKDDRLPLRTFIPSTPLRVSQSSNINVASPAPPPPPPPAPTTNGQKRNSISSLNSNKQQPVSSFNKILSEIRNFKADRLKATNSNDDGEEYEPASPPANFGNQSFNPDPNGDNEYWLKEIDNLDNLDKSKNSGKSGDYNEIEDEKSRDEGALW